MLPTEKTIEFLNKIKELGIDINFNNRQIEFLNKILNKENFPEGLTYKEYKLWGKDFMEIIEIIWKACILQDYTKRIETFADVKDLPI